MRVQQVYKKSVKRKNIDPRLSKGLRGV